MYNGQERNIYIEGEERWTRTHRVREVRNRASPNRSRETNETLGIDLTQREKVEWRWVRNECSVGNVLLRRKGVRGFGDALDASWLGMEPEGLGLALGARGWF